MPKVVVYVPATQWRLLEAVGLDPAERVRQIVRAGLSLGSGAAGGESPSADGRTQDTPSVRVTAPDDHFKPDPKPVRKK